MVPRGNTGLSSQEPLVMFLLTDRYITLFYVHFCLKTPNLIYIVIHKHWSHSQQHYNSCLNKTYLTCIFSIRHILAFLSLRTPHQKNKQTNIRQHVRIRLGGHFKPKSQPWLAWLSRRSAGLRTERSPVWFPVRAQAWVVGQGCRLGVWSELCQRQLASVSLTRWYFYPSLPPLPSF